jgi:hypothetical protein
VSEQLPSSLESCDTVAKINFSCPSDTSASNAAVSGNKASTFRVDSASDDTFSALRGTETPFYETNGVSPATDPVIETGETLCDIAKRYPCLSLRVLEQLPHADTVVNGRPRQPLCILNHNLLTTRLVQRVQPFCLCLDVTSTPASPLRHATSPEY